MANDEDVARLRQGAAVWNDWRAQNPERHVDLSGAKLPGANLRGANLHAADLRRSNLRGANLDEANLHEADLGGANLRAANLPGANLRGAKLRGANLRGAKLGGPDLIRANLHEADLGGAILTGAMLIGVNLHEADLGGAILTGAILLGAILSGANLRRANLERACLYHANLRDANLQEANLSGANLTGAILAGAILPGADLSGRDLGGTNLERANLAGANLRGAKLRDTNLRDANLSGANLHEMDLSEMDLSGVDLRDADLRQASLIDSRLDRANLTGVSLWETQRAGWSIKGVICQRAFWDRDSKEGTEYEVGDFERIFAEKPRIVLRYPGGMSPVDLAMLPLIVERLQAEHPDCALHIRSVQDDGSGAVVTITVDDRTGRDAETVRSEVETLRCEFMNVQQRLNQEVRQQIEARFTDMTKLFEMSPTQINVGHLTGYITVEGNAMSRDTYNIPGQAGAVGPKAHAHNMTFQQVSSESGLDLPRLAQELARLRAAMKQETEGTAEQDEAIGAVAAAEKAAAQGDGPTVLQHLKAAGKWTLEVAEKIGVAVAAKAIGSAMGMPA